MEIAALLPVGNMGVFARTFMVSYGLGSGRDRAKKKCEQCPHFSPQTWSYSHRIGPDSVGFRLFPVITRPGIPFESHLGHSVSAGQRAGWSLSVDRMLTGGPLRGPFFVSGCAWLSWDAEGLRSCFFMVGQGLFYMTSV